MKHPNWESLVKTCSGDIRRLTSVWRFSSIPIVCPENVADHSWYVVVYSAMIHRALEPMDTSLLGPILLHAAVHDVPECISGDVVRVFKYTTPQLKQEIDKAEHILVEKFPHHLKDLMKLNLEWTCGDHQFPPDLADQREYVEAIVKAADFMSLFQFMRREAMKGNLEIIPFYNRFLDDLGYLGNGAQKRNFNQKEFFGVLHKEALTIGNECFKNVNDWQSIKKDTI